MNRQTNYIVYAVLLLLLIAGGYLFFSKIRPSVVANEQNPVSDTLPVSSSSYHSNEDGKKLFRENCSSCHQLFKDATGPALANLEERGPWRNRKAIYEWMKNPGLFMQKDSYTKTLKAKFGSLQTSFQLTKQQIDAILDYIKTMSKQISYQKAIS